MKKWLMFVLIGLVALALIGAPKKEGKFGFRCSEDEHSIEVFNKESGKYVTFEDCGEGLCSMTGGPAVCEQAQKEQQESISYTPALWLGIIGLILYWRRKK